MTPPADAPVWDLAGKTVYVGFIDAYSRYGLAPGDAPAPLRPEKPGRRKYPPAPATLSGSSTGMARPPKNGALGFVDALVVPGRGIFRGRIALVYLSGKPGGRSLVPGVALQHVAFDERHPDAPDLYRDSLMGCIALVRQTLLDARWYQEAQAFYLQHPGGTDRPETNAAFAALVVPKTVAAPCPGF